MYNDYTFWFELTLRIIIYIFIKINYINKTQWMKYTVLKMLQNVYIYSNECVIIYLIKKKNGLLVN